MLICADLFVSNMNNFFLVFYWETKIYFWFFDTKTCSLLAMDELITTYILLKKYRKGFLFTVSLQSNGNTAAQPAEAMYVYFPWSMTCSQHFLLPTYKYLFGVLFNNLIICWTRYLSTWQFFGVVSEPIKSWSAVAPSIVLLQVQTVWFR